MSMRYSLEQLLATQCFVLRIKGEYSPREETYWDAWLSEYPNQRRVARKANEIVEPVYSQHEIPDWRVELQKLSREINQRKRSQLGLSSYASRSTWWQQIGAVAAGLIFLTTLLRGIHAYQYDSAEKAGAEKGVLSQKEFNKEYTTDYGEKVTFRLSDGSNITLNGHSKLRFSSTLEKGGNTQVWLQGEAYFDIAHLEGDNQRTFMVHTNDGAIQGLGTRFAVNTFGPGTQTALEQGKINIRI